MKNYRALLAVAALLLMSGLAAGRYFADVPGEGPALAFYWWKSVYDPLPEEQDMAAESGASRLYLRFFDVVGKGGWPVPAATVAFRQRPELPVIPVVFIDNEAVRDSGGESGTSPCCGKSRRGCRRAGGFPSLCASTPSAIRAKRAFRPRTEPRSWPIIWANCAGPASTIPF